MRPTVIVRFEPSEEVPMASTARKPPVRSTTTKKISSKRLDAKASAPAKKGAKRLPVKKSPTPATVARKTATAKKPAPRSGRRGSAARDLRVALELGPKGKKLAAVAPDWPGLERGAKTAEAAIEALRAYMPRYAAVAKLAGLDEEFGKIIDVQVVEQYEGPGSTDFWGISFGFSNFDQQEMSRDRLDRELSLMQACWKYFDGVRARVSSEMLKGPRGGGRNRDRIVSHTIGVEQDWAKKLGVRVPVGEVVTDSRGLKKYRTDYCAAIRAFHAEGRRARTWPLRYLIRHTAYHTMDHAWEMEDKDQHAH
jgi:hypothetical protein